MGRWIMGQPIEEEEEEIEQLERLHTRTLATKIAEADFWKRKYRELLTANATKAYASERVPSPGDIDLDAVAAAATAFLREEQFNQETLRQLGSRAYAVPSRRQASRERFGRAVRAAVAKRTAKKGRR